MLDHDELDLQDQVYSPHSSHIFELTLELSAIVEKSTLKLLFFIFF